MYSILEELHFIEGKLTIHYPQEKKYSSPGTSLNISWLDSLLINLPATSICL